MGRFLVAGVVGVVALWAIRRRKASGGAAPEAPAPPPTGGRAAKAGATVTLIGRLLLAIPVVWAVAAMAEGCEDEPSDPSTPATAEVGDDEADDERPERITCGSYREEDCPPYPSVLVPGDGSG